MTYSSLIAILPLRLVCHLIVPGAGDLSATNFGVNQSPPQIQLPIYTNGVMAAPLAELPLQLICRLLVTSNPSIAENSSSVESEAARQSVPQESTRSVPLPNKDAAPIPVTISPIQIDEGSTILDVSTRTPPLKETETSQEDYGEAYTIVIQTESPLEDYVPFTDIQRAYKVHEDEEVTWYEARDRCAAEGAILAIPDSVEKIKHIKSLQLKTDEDKWLHTGIWKSNATNEWVRIDNDLPVSYIPWTESSPDDMGDCTGVSLGGNELINYLCEWGGEHYVCEKPIEAY